MDGCTQNLQDIKEALIKASFSWNASSRPRWYDEVNNALRILPTGGSITTVTTVTTVTSVSQLAGQDALQALVFRQQRATWAGCVRSRIL